MSQIMDPSTPLEELTALPRLYSWSKGSLILTSKGKKGRGKGPLRQIPRSGPDPVEGTYSASQTPSRSKGAILLTSKEAEKKGRENVP